MDTRTYPMEVTRGTLAFLSLTNRRFGGNSVVLRRLEDWSRRWRPGETISLLDVGTGGGDIALAAARWARRRDFHIKITAVDLMPDIAEIARENARGFPEIKIVDGNAFELESGEDRWDYVTASLFLHHVPPAENVRALKKLDALARKGLFVSDLERSLPSYMAVGALSRIAGNAVVRHDGPLSVRRAFTFGELNALAQEAGLPHLRARKEMWFRLSLAGEK
jgi:2-polyprenyl-3-methyl-5-hydroxy-6-metoxy-1,4-benzoquinol methylase